MHTLHFIYINCHPFTLNYPYTSLYFLSSITLILLHLILYYYSLNPVKSHCGKLYVGRREYNAKVEYLCNQNNEPTRSIFLMKFQSGNSPSKVTEVEKEYLQKKADQYLLRTSLAIPYFAQSIARRVARPILSLVLESVSIIPSKASRATAASVPPLRELPVA